MLLGPQVACCQCAESRCGQLTQVSVRQVGDSCLYPAAGPQVVLEYGQHILFLLQDGISLLEQLLWLQQRIIVWRCTCRRASCRRLRALARSSTLCSAAAHAGGAEVLLLLASGNNHCKPCGGITCRVLHLLSDRL